MTAASPHSPGVLDEATGIGVADASSNNNPHHDLTADLTSFPSPPNRKASIPSRFTGVDPLDSSDPVPGHMPGSFPDGLPTFDGPSSAPPTPSVISVTHPSQFIHTHHPRRGSLTPLGLNVISPVPPQLQQQSSMDGGSASGHGGGSGGGGFGGIPFSSSPMRTVGFSATDGSSYSLEAARRDSVATVSSSASKTSVASNLTATRPGYSSGGIGGGSFYRRSSLTPSLQSVPPPATQQQPQRAPGSTPLFDPSRRRGSLTPSLPTLSAPSPTRALVAGKLAVKTPTGELPGHASTMDVLPGERRGSAAALLSESRRGSLPQLYYGAWTGPGDRRDSGDSQMAQEPTIKRGFKFGSITTAEPPDFEGSLQRIAQLSSAKKTESSAFEAAEQAEAERQRRAFLAATYGEEGRRARARLSLGGNSASPASPASTRRQSLMLWERIKGSDGSASTGHGTPGRSTMTSSGEDLVAIRRPSLPVNIPRTPRADQAALFDDQTVWDDPDALPDVEDPGMTPQRPLPPLLPLSDPVPRLLPSTLALHRATHLLNARNLSSEPLPAPLPPTLHPPQPVDLSEFDIDFILAGSRTQLGRTGSKGSQRRSTLSGRGSDEGHGRPGGLEEEDSFAKFVGAFDDEYGGRRGEWTFRALPRPVQPIGQNPTRPVPRAEWESPGAGRYEIYPSGDVRSVESGSVWRMKRTSTREYELEQPMPGLLPVVNVDKPPPNAPQPVILSPCSGYTLTSKLVHTENGGVKLPIPVHRELSRGSRFSRRFVAAARNRQSITDSLYETDERKRTGSQDSSATATANARLILQPLQPPAMRHHNSNTSSNSNPTPPSLSPPKDECSPKEKRGSKSKKEIEDDKKKEKGFSGVLKRSLFKATNMIEESKERSGKFWPNGSSGGSYSLKSSAPIHRPLPHQQSDRSDAASASSQHSSKYTSESADEEQNDELFGSLGLGIEDEQNGGHPWKEGKAWDVVPDDALAMVIPIESDKSGPPLPHTPAATKAFINPFFVDGPRQALLVWFTPFNSASALDRPERQGSSTLFKITESPHHEVWEGGQHMSSSLSRLPKLLRPRGSRIDNVGSLSGSKHIPVRPPASTPPTEDDTDRSRSSSRASRNLQPLPFKGYRVVAKVVDTEDLRSQSEIPVIGLEAWTEQLRTGKPAGVNTPPPLDGPVRADPETAVSSRSGSDDKDTASSVMSGRAFPTVIAVCHNQTSGVEFVLEGLDRLGLCTGESAWGPTGYEEWRGTGLSVNGRQMLDLLWAACTAVMGV